MPDSLIDFIGIGAPRCGTTWIAECLRQHPDVLLPLRSDGADGELGYEDLLDAKELNFFTDLKTDSTYFVPPNNRHEGLDWYLRRFPSAQPGKVRGEISTVYFRDPSSPGLITQTFPDIKLLLSLRNPADMIHSFYWLQKYGKMTETFEELLDRGLYLETGLHAKHLARYLEKFPRERIHVILFEDIAEKPEQVVRALYGFLGVRADFRPSVLGKKINAARVVRSGAMKVAAVRMMAFARRHGRSFVEKYLSENRLLKDSYRKLNLGKRTYAPMRRETRARLEAYYREDIGRLEHLIDRDLSAWKTGSPRA